MRYKMIYILFLIFLLITIPYVITVFLSQQDKNIQFENYDSGYQVISGNDKDDLETYLLKILPGQISMDQENEAVKAQAVILRTDIIRRMENKKQIARQKLPYTTYENSEYRKSLEIAAIRAWIRNEKNQSVRHEERLSHTKTNS